MPYLQPNHVLQQFANYLSDDVRSAIEDDEKFVQAQVGSMSSSLNFLSKELSGMHVAVNTQKRQLERALDDIESRVSNDESADTVLEAIDDARSALEEADRAEARELEQTVTAAATDVISAINQDLDDEAARRARRPFYEFLETRVQTQLDVLGRE
jgi:Mg2+ and Co2+ transporter CorA